MCKYKCSQAEMQLANGVGLCINQALMMTIQEDVEVRGQEYPPHVQAGGVVCGSQQDIWRPVPQGHHLIGVGMAGDRLCPGQAWRGSSTTTLSQKALSLTDLHLGCEKQSRVLERSCQNHCMLHPSIWLHTHRQIKCLKYIQDAIEFSMLVQEICPCST